MPGSLETIAYHPLTGGRQIVDGSGWGDSSGLELDRKLLLFTGDNATGYERYSTKRSQSPAIRRIGSVPTSSGFEITFFDENGIDVVDEFELGFPFGDTTDVDEFGTTTPVIAYDRNVSMRFADFLSTGNRLRIGLKDFTNSKSHPALWGNAPYHIQSMSSLRAISEQTGIELTELIARYRPNFVVDQPKKKAGSELGWRMVRIGSTDFVIHKTTVRCEVPDQDPLTGKSDSSVSKVSIVNRNLPRRMSGGKLKSILGLYAFSLDDSSSYFQVGDSVNVTSRTSI